MRKLTLESLQVESFETTAPGQPARGTVQGHLDDNPGTGATGCYACEATRNCESFDPAFCRDTEYLDCTFQCTRYCSGDRTCDCPIDDHTNYCPVE